MRKRALPLKRALRCVLLILLLGIAGMTKVYASYDFSAVCPTGQTLYYNITNAANHYVELACPGNATSLYDSWAGFTRPTGDIILPSNVEYNGVTYTVTSFGVYALGGCQDLTGSLVIPNTVTSIGYCAVYGCKGFTSIEIPSSVTSIGDYAFFQCSGWRGTLVIPGAVTSIGNLAFAYCPFLNSIELSDAVTTIGNCAFEHCTYLRSVEIPRSVTTIGDRAFYECTWLEQIVVEAGNTAYDSRGNCNAIINSNTNELILGCKNTTIPNSVTSIGSYAFYSCNQLTSINMPHSVTSIGACAFYGCSGLTSLEMSHTLTSIGDFAFYACTGLTGHLTIPNLVTSIGDYAFIGCSGLTSLTLPASLTSVGEYAFANCYDITSVNYLGSLSQWCNINYSYDITEGGYSCYYYSQSYDLIIGNALVTDLVVPENVTEIKDFAFVGCRSLSSLTIPNSVTKIGAGAFRLCRGLQSVTIGNSVTSIGKFAFHSCNGLTGNLTIPNSVTSIGRKAFYGCKGLTGLTIGNSVTTIAPNAFTNCSGLTSMTVLAENPPVLGIDVFNNINTSIPVCVPCGAMEVYQNAERWNVFTNIQDLCTQTQTVALSPGWNWYSTYIEQEGIDGLIQLENSIGIPNVTIQSRGNGYVKSVHQNGTTVWRGQLSTINNDEMYKIGTNEACVATMSGVITDPANHPITIIRGWNWIGFPCSQCVSVDVALSGFTPKNGDIIKGKDGSATYSNGMWSGTLNTLEPGQGYMYGSKSNSVKTLVFQTGSRAEATLANITPESNYYQPVEDYADNMTVIAVVELDGEELRSDNYELAAFAGDECRGSVKLMYVESLNRYVAFLTVFGDEAENLHFVLTDGATSNLSADHMTYATDGIEGTLDEPVVLRFGASDVNENATADVRIYPNPSEGVFNIEGSNIKRVEVFNALGQPVCTMETESSLLKLDLTNRPSGIYLIRVITSDGIKSHQVMKR